jgi:hypothetical protein
VALSTAVIFADVFIAADRCCTRQKVEIFVMD